ncbi:hypothetical protein V8F33_011773 [Rhypophila sp. PSN 637]
MERKRIVHRLDTPYSMVEWPVISQQDQDVILELLCNLLAPIGLHRKAFLTPSKGKRKRKQPKDESEPPKPPAPEISDYVDVGLAHISRNLQEMAATGGSQNKENKSDFAPIESSEALSQTAGEEQGGRSGNSTKRAADKIKPPSSPYSVIFVARSGQSSAFHCHFPQMVAMASKSQPREKAVRLVGFSKSCEDKLTEALGIPRVSSIALREDAPALRVKGLVDYVREHVAPVEVAWLEEASSGKYRETNIEAVPTKIGQARVKR